MQCLILESGLGQGCCKMVLQSLIKLNIHLQCEPAILILGIYFKRNEYTCSPKDLVVNVCRSFLHISLKLETDKNDQQMLRSLGENLTGNRIFA